MAKGSGIGTIIGLGAAGLGVWWASTQNWFGLFGAPVTVPATGATAGGIVPASTPMPTTVASSISTPAAAVQTPAAASVTLIGAVSKTSNNALKGTFSINGVSQSISVIPGGDAYNDSGQGITAQLASQGVTPAQLYAILSAAYQPPAATPVSSSAQGVTLIGAVSKTVNNALKGTFSINGVQQSIAVIPGGGAYNDAGQNITTQLAAQGVTPAQLYAILSGASGGLGAYQPTMVFANRGNYVRAGSRYR